MDTPATPALRAIIYVPDGPDRARWTMRCLKHCRDHDYSVVAVTPTGEAGWHDIIQMIAADEADVIVVGRREHLDPQRTPRTEIAEGPQEATPRQRRPKDVRATKK